VLNTPPTKEMCLVKEDHISHESACPDIRVHKKLVLKNHRHKANTGCMKSSHHTKKTVQGWRFILAASWRITLIRSWFTRNMKRSPAICNRNKIKEIEF
jgi:hypothetical protein